MIILQKVYCQWLHDLRIKVQNLKIKLIDTINYNKTCKLNKLLNETNKTYISSLLENLSCCSYSNYLTLSESK